ncbi:hypothetical protein NDN08_005790 [Rhodosorus marinus]|uniref:DUF3752 domain-containing protein n=1 Tax=Rhodosorus marinus TaxID=101924 RepID=A0AAV8V2M2_9RHOD|nr:hypothetical protein NDN08_005790 [Rhodosorus marinus]
MIGPALPPHLRRKMEEEQEVDEEQEVRSDGDDDGGGIVGPTLPSRKRKPEVGGVEGLKDGDMSDSEGEDVYGPRAPRGAKKKDELVSDASKWEGLRKEDEEIRKSRAAFEGDEYANAGKAREEWMLSAPEAKPSGTGNRFRPNEVAKADLSWMHTPGKKHGKGTGERTARGSGPTDVHQQEEEEQEMAEKVRLVDEHTRGKRSLLEIHEEDARKKSKALESKAAGPLSWDRERDLVDNHKRVDASAYVKKIGRLNERFSSGQRDREKEQRHGRLKQGSMQERVLVLGKDEGSGWDPVGQARKKTSPHIVAGEPLDGKALGILGDYLDLSAGPDL